MTWLILDLLLIIIVIICVVKNYRRGFVSALIGIAAVILSLLVAYYLSGKLAEPVYEAFVRENLIEQVDARIQEGGSLDELGGFLGGLLSGEDSAQEILQQGGTAETIVDNALENPAKSAIRTALLLLIYVVVSLLLRFIARRLRGLNKVPLLGGINRLLGALFGFGVGMVYALLFVSLCALIISLSLDSLSWLNTGIIERTWLVSLLYPYNLVAALI